MFSKKFLLSLCLLWIAGTGLSQTNISVTNPSAEQVLQNNYNPSNYAASTVYNHPDYFSCHLQNTISPDSLKQYILQLQSFYTRQTFSDTTSDTRGIGAARRWVHQKFRQFSQSNENRLLTSYLAFDMTSTYCSKSTRAKNIFGVLPSADTSQPSVIIYVAHLDSRCVRPCDDTCYAPGADDNASGTALVMELARVMSQFTLDHTVVFMTTSGEEQGLFGANAFADYLQSNNIPVKAVYNEDTEGNIVCGYSSPSPKCPYAGHIDSTHTRLFSAGDFNSPHKGLGRWVKLEYNEEMKPIADVPMTIELMKNEDRAGRGGDHTAFQTMGPAIRIMEANEHGDGAPDKNGDGQIDTSYKSRQHTNRDVAGVDTDNDGQIDSFFIDFDYLSRNTMIPGLAGALSGINPDPPKFTLYNDPNGVWLQVTSQTQYQHYRVGIRSDQHDFDRVYTFRDTLEYTIPGLIKDSTYVISVASVDENGIESFFSGEEQITPLGSSASQAPDTSVRVVDCDTVLTALPSPSSPSLNRRVRLLPAYPNPTQQSVTIPIRVSAHHPINSATLQINDIYGRTVLQRSISLSAGRNHIPVKLPDNEGRLLFYRLIVDGQPTVTKKLIQTP